MLGYNRMVIVKTTALLFAVMGSALAENHFGKSIYPLCLR